MAKKPRAPLSDMLYMGRVHNPPRVQGFESGAYGDELDHTDDNAGVVFFNPAQMARIAGMLYRASRKWPMDADFINFQEVQELYDGALQIMAMKQLAFTGNVQTDSAWSLSILPDPDAPGTFNALLKHPSLLGASALAGLKFRRSPGNDPNEYRLQLSSDNGVTWSDTDYNLYDMPLYSTAMGSVTDTAQTTVGSFLVEESGYNPETNAYATTYRLELDRSKFKGDKGDAGTNGTNGQNAPLIQIVHTYKLSPGSTPFFRLATNEEQIEWLGAVGSGVIPVVIGLVTGDTGGGGATGATGAKGDKGDKGDPGDPCSCGEPPDPPGTNGDAKRCNVASGVGGMVSGLFDDYLNFIDAEIATLSTPALMAGGLINQIPFFGPALNFLFSSLTIAFNTNATIIRAEHTTATKERIQCELYCLLSQAGTLTDAIITAWANRLGAIFPEPYAGCLKNFVLSLDNTKLRARAYIYAGIAGHCEFCLCQGYDWEYTFDFEHSDAASGTFSSSEGTFTSGQGFVASNANNPIVDTAFPQWQVSPSRMKFVLVDWSTTNCDPNGFLEVHVQGINDTYMRTPIGSGRQVYVFSMDENLVNGANHNSARLSALAASHGDMIKKIHRITFRGTGTKPPNAHP